MEDVDVHLTALKRVNIVYVFVDLLRLCYFTILLVFSSR